MPTVFFSQDELTEAIIKAKAQGASATLRGLATEAVNWRPDMSAIAEQHKIGLNAGFRQAIVKMVESAEALAEKLT